MARSDILLYDDGVFGFPNSKRFKVNGSASATSIKAGELVLTSIGNQGTAGSAGKGSYVTKWTVSSTAKPALGTDWVAGLAASDSTDTTTAGGTVDVFPNLPGMTYIGNPDTAATWNTQAKYDLLVGARVLLSTTAAGVQTVLATDHANAGGGGVVPFSGNGLVVEPLDVIKYPGKVRFSIKWMLDPRNV